ncbi:MAG: hypothetical protein QM742_02470 [Aquabacterium sp.]
MNPTIRHAVMPALLSALTLCLASAAHAQASSPQHDRIDRRQQRQEQRIDRGVENGSLTRPEARRLEREQHRIDRAEDRMQADGKVTPAEAARMEARQDHASRHIRHAKHDRQHRR